MRTSDVVEAMADGEIATSTWVSRWTSCCRPLPRLPIAIGSISTSTLGGPCALGSLSEIATQSRSESASGFYDVVCSLSLTDPPLDFLPHVGHEGHILTMSCDELPKLIRRQAVFG